MVNNSVEAFIVELNHAASLTRVWQDGKKYNSQMNKSEATNIHLVSFSFLFIIDSKLM